MAKKLELTEEIKNKIIELIEVGCTDQEVFGGIGISRHKFYDWMNEYPEFREEIKKIRRPLNQNVEASLYKRANGFEYDEVEQKRDRETGEMVVTKITKKLMPPDVGAQKFWLRNRVPKRWPDRHDVELRADNVTINVDPDFLGEKIKKEIEKTT